MPTWIFNFVRLYSFAVSSKIGRAACRGGVGRGGEVEEGGG